ncbi:MAG: viral replication protein [Firmicutes bacterium]|nr:viral replication protein [Bacillota bacterium]
MSNSQSRKWILVINNPNECEFTHERICEIMMKFFPDYFCMADEVAKTGTFHTHIFIYSHSPIRFSTLKNRFPIAHIEKAIGSAKQNRDYILKTGKWENDEKAETSVEGSFYEYGTLPKEREENNPKMSMLIENIRGGKQTSEIIEDAPEFAFRIRDIDALRQVLNAEKYLSENRDLYVTYIFGASGTGKTRSIYKKHNAKDICRITNYRIGKGVSFDGYSGQDVLVFEEFNSQIPIEEMLNFLDIYPLNLPARYNDRTACYTKVYITSNIPFSEQYKDVQVYRPETWKAFSRRIHKVLEYLEDGTILERSTKL